MAIYWGPYPLLKGLLGAKPTVWKRQGLLYVAKCIFGDRSSAQQVGRVYTHYILAYRNWTCTILEDVSHWKWVILIAIFTRGYLGTAKSWFADHFTMINQLVKGGKCGCFLGKLFSNGEKTGTARPGTVFLGKTNTLEVQRRDQKWDPVWGYQTMQTWNSNHPLFFKNWQRFSWMNLNRYIKNWCQTPFPTIK